MSGKDEAESISSKIHKLKIDVAPDTSSAARNTPSTKGAPPPPKKEASPGPPARTTLLLRDLPPQTTEAEILALFEPSASAPTGKQPGDAAVPGRADVLSVQREFDNTWALRFPSEELCVQAALALPARSLHGEQVHCRVDSCTPPPRAALRPEPAQWLPPDLERYAASSPVFYSTPPPSSSFSPVLSPGGADAILESIRVPDGVFGGFPPGCVPVSPMCRILGGEPPMPPPNFYDFSAGPQHSEKIIRQYRKMLKIKQESLDRSSNCMFPANMVRSLPKAAVARLLRQLEKCRWEAPSSLRRRDGGPRYFARSEPLSSVRYGAGMLPLNSPNRAAVSVRA